MLVTLDIPDVVRGSLITPGSMNLPSQLLLLGQVLGHDDLDSLLFWGGGIKDVLFLYYPSSFVVLTKLAFFLLPFSPLVDLVPFPGFIVVLSQEQ